MKNISVIHSNAMEELPKLETNSVDLTILDPDYNDWENLINQGLICEAKRITKPTGNIIMFTKQPFDFSLRFCIDDIFRREIVWTFTNGGAWVSNKMPLVSFQKIYWCVLGKDFYFNPRTGIEYSENTKDFKRATKVFGGYNEEGRAFKKSNDGVWLRDHLHYNKPQFGSIPAKPQELLDVIVRCFCPQDGIVMDPFAGSGNVALAAMNNNCNYVGYELDEDRYESIIKRLDL